MKCDYCGKELPLGTTVCDGCGAKFESNKVSNVNATPYQGTSDMQPNYNAQQPYYGAPKKSGTGLKVTIIVLIIIIVALLGVGAWFLFGGGDDKEESSDSKKDKDNVEDKVDNKKDNDDDNDNDNDHYDDDDDDYDNDKDNDKDKDDDNDDQKPNYGSSKTITFSGYTLSVPKGFDVSDGNGNGTSYIYNDECLIMYAKYALDYDSLLKNKDTFVKELEKAGMKVNSFDTKTIDGQKFILLKGVMTYSDTEFGYMFTDLGGDTPMFLTISSSNLGDFDDDWFDYGAEFANSARK